MIVYKLCSIHKLIAYAMMRIVCSEQTNLTTDSIYRKAAKKVMKSHGEKSFPLFRVSDLMKMYNYTHEN